MQKKFCKFKCKELLSEDIFPNHIATLVNYDILDDDDKEKLISLVEFKINKESNFYDKNGNKTSNPCWKLIDNQGANLGNIESEQFSVGNYDAMIDRLDIYWHDYGIYFLNELEELKKKENIEYNIIDEDVDLKDLVEVCDDNKINKYNEHICEYCGCNFKIDNILCEASIYAIWDEDKQLYTFDISGTDFEIKCPNCYAYADVNAEITNLINS